MVLFERQLSQIKRYYYTFYVIYLNNNPPKTPSQVFFGEIFKTKEFFPNNDPKYLGFRLLNNGT